MSGGNFKRRLRKERSNRDSFFRADGADPGKAVCRGNGRVGDGVGGGTECGIRSNSRGGTGSAGRDGGAGACGSGVGPQSPASSAICAGGGTGNDGAGGDDDLSWVGP